MIRKILYSLVIFLSAFLLIGSILTFSEPLSFSTQQDQYSNVVQTEWSYYKTKFSGYTGIITHSTPTTNDALQSTIVITPEIKELALNLTKNSSSEITSVFSLYHYVSAIPYEHVSGISSSVDTLKVQKGDCIDKAVLLSALLTSVGFKNYVAISYPHNYISHAFNLVYVNGTWIPVDTTTNFYSIPGYEISELYNFNETRVVSTPFIV